MCVSCHAPRERVSWNFFNWFRRKFALRHAPRERVSWNLSRFVNTAEVYRHAPRERVSWNCAFIQFLTISPVTLHVSVWVEMLINGVRQIPPCVTLHVSVWVEILKWGRRRRNYMSRSTWACELKYQRDIIKLEVNESRSTWACELKFIIDIMINYNSTSRSTWACELKCRSSSSSVSRPVVTLHVSVWVEISLRSTSRTRKKVTLHVSVWVEISLTVVGSQLRMSRSTWACELKYQCCHMPERDN